MSKKLVIILLVVLISGCTSAAPEAGSQPSPIPSSTPAAASEVLATNTFEPTSAAADPTPDIERLLNDLKNGNAKTRWYAARMLLGSSDPRVIEPLIEAMKDEDATVRQQAIIALEGIPDARILQPMIDALSDPDQEVRLEAASGVSTHTDARTAQTYLSALSVEDFILISYRFSWYFQAAVPGTEVILVELLNKLGFQETYEQYISISPYLPPKEIAQIYINSGNQILEAAAMDWAARNGYTLVKAADPANYEQWGSH